IGSVLPAQTLLEVERLAALHPLVHPRKVLELVGVPYRPREVWTAKLFDRAAEIVERGWIRVEPPALRVEHDDVLRTRVDEVVKFLLLPSQRDLRLLPVLDVDARPVPSPYRARLVAERDHAHHEPAIRSVRTA